MLNAPHLLLSFKYRFLRSTCLSKTMSLTPRVGSIAENPLSSLCRSSLYRMRQTLTYSFPQRSVSEQQPLLSRSERERMRVLTIKSIENTGTASQWPENTFAASGYKVLRKCVGVCFTILHFFVDFIQKERAILTNEVVPFWRPKRKGFRCEMYPRNRL